MKIFKANLKRFKELTLGLGLVFGVVFIVALIVAFYSTPEPNYYALLLIWVIYLGLSLFVLYYFLVTKIIITDDGKLIYKKSFFAKGKEILISEISQVKYEKGIKPTLISGSTLIFGIYYDMVFYSKNGQKNLTIPLVPFEENTRKHLFETLQKLNSDIEIDKKLYIR